MTKESQDKAGRLSLRQQNKIIIKSKPCELNNVNGFSKALSKALLFTNGISIFYGKQDPQSIIFPLKKSLKVREEVPELPTLTLTHTQCISDIRVILE